MMMEGEFALENAQVHVITLVDGLLDTVAPAGLIHDAMYGFTSRRALFLDDESHTDAGQEVADVEQDQREDNRRRQERFAPAGGCCARACGVINIGGWGAIALGGRVIHTAADRGDDALSVGPGTARDIIRFGYGKPTATAVVAALRCTGPDPGIIALTPGTTANPFIQLVFCAQAHAHIRAHFHGLRIGRFLPFLAFFWMVAGGTVHRTTPCENRGIGRFITPPRLRIRATQIGHPISK